MRLQDRILRWCWAYIYKRCSIICITKLEPLGPNENRDFLTSFEIQLEARDYHKHHNHDFFQQNFWVHRYDPCYEIPEYIKQLRKIHNKCKKI